MSTSVNVNTYLAFRHIFGVSNTVTDNIAVLDETKVAYVAGHSIVIHDKVENRQQLIQGGEINETITAFTVGFTRKHAAVAERGDRPKIHIFDLTTARLRKTLIAVDIKGKEMVCLQFSEDDQMILTLSGFPDFTLMCWNWMKGKLIASILVSQGVNMTRCSFNPTVAKDPLACVSGKDTVKFFRISDRNIRLLKESNMEGHNFTSHYWMRESHEHDTVVAATENGDLVVYRLGDYICKLSCSPGPSCSISCLLPMTKGFIIGSKSGESSMVKFTPVHYMVKETTATAATGNNSANTFQINSKDDEDDGDIINIDLYSSQFTVTNAVKADISTGSVLAMSLSPNENFVVSLFSDCQIATMPLNTHAALSSEQIKHLACSFHEPKPILGLDVCMKKSLIISCAADNTLRIWDFSRNTLEIHKTFLEEMLSVALHPTGLQCMIGFIDRLRFYHILVDDLKMCLEVPIKNCRECRFNKGGNLVAAVSGNGIVVYDFYKGGKIADLKGHNGKVRSLFWLDSGHELLSCGQDGAIYQWDVLGSKRTMEFLKKGVMYTSVVQTALNGSVFAVGSDRTLKELYANDLSLARDVDSEGVMLNQIALCISKKSVLTSTCEPGKPGTIRVYSYPILIGEYTEYMCTSTAVSKLVMTPDENFVIVADEAGCICIFEIHDRPVKVGSVPVGSGTRRKSVTLEPTELLSVENWSDEVLIPRIDLEERAHTIADLKMKLREQKFQNDFKVKLKETEYTEHTKEVTEKFIQELENAKLKMDVLREEKSRSEAKCIEQLKQQSDLHQHNIQTSETKFQAALMEKVEAYHQLMRKKDAQRDRLEDQRKKLKIAHERYLRELIKDYDMKLESSRLGRIAAENDKADLLRNVSEMQTQLEDDIDTEIENMVKTYNDKLAISRENSMKYKGQLGINKKKCSVVQKEMEDLREIMAQLYDRERDIHEQIVALEKEIAIHKKEIKARDVSIGEKEKRVYELKKKNQELDKFKFVLDFKIRELKQQIEPRQKEIAEMKDKIKEMDASLEEYHNKNSSLDDRIGAIRAKIDEITTEIKTARISAKKNENTINNFRIDINQSVQYILTPDQLLIATERILKSYNVGEDRVEKDDGDMEVEYGRHKEFLNTSVAQIKHALTQEMAARSSTNSKLMQDNMVIIGEINKQRSTNKSLKMSIQADIGRMRHLASKKRRSIPRLTFDDSTSFESVGESSSTAAAISDPVDQLERNRVRMDILRQVISSMEASIVQRSYSREILPPMETLILVEEQEDADSADV